MNGERLPAAYPDPFRVSYGTTFQKRRGLTSQLTPCRGEMQPAFSCVVRFDTIARVRDNPTPLYYRHLRGMTIPHVKSTVQLLAVMNSQKPDTFIAAVADGTRSFRLVREQEFAW